MYYTQMNPIIISEFLTLIDDSLKIIINILKIHIF